MLVSIEYAVTAWSKLAALLLKPPSSPQVILGDVSYRMIPATSPTAALIDVPSEAGWNPFVDPLSGGVGQLRVDRPAEVTVWTMNVTTSL
jgi:hypothetical protein